MTPAERRAALMVVFLLLLGAAQDLWRSRHLRTVRPRGQRVENRAQAGAGGDRESRVPMSVAPSADRGSARRADPLAVPPADSVAVLLDLNRASAEELDRLPGLGPTLAQRIVEHRQRHGAFRYVDELRAVRGIGPRLLERLKPRLTLGEQQR